MLNRDVNKRILMTGVTGSLGSQIAAKFLIRGAHVLAGARCHHDPLKVKEFVLDNLQEVNDSSLSHAEIREIASRLEVLPLQDIMAAPKSYDIDEIIHCAASMDYNNPQRLFDANVSLTEELLEASKKADVERFIYLSTAFSSGCRKTVVPEALHDENCVDLTDYTSTKRKAEHLVADSGLSYMILRPTIVIGDSRTGRYTGRPNGLYQLWATAERLFIQAQIKAKWVIAPKLPLPLLHQDAFLAAVESAYHYCESGAIVNIASDHQQLPTSRTIAELWLKKGNHDPKELVFLDALDEMAKNCMDRLHKLFYRRVATNVHFANHLWQFDTGTLRHLQQKGLQFHDANFESVKRCHHWFTDRLLTTA